MKTWIIGFFILQIGLDWAHSVTAFPVVHYGMFSESFPRQDSVTVFRVSVDGQWLQPAGFSIYRWDMIQTPLEAAEKRASTNDFAFDKERLQAGLRTVGLSTLFNTLKPNLDNTGAFLPWYKNYLSRLLGRPVAVVRVEKAVYRWTAGRMQLIKSENWING
ncbi:hypothetical protein [Puia sp.]|jgi:hypothetical protein|uniref:hypothetical protein n=1 Tax=Puia sp. TaxID=2045100 RepID=UPI002F3E9CE3